MTEHVEGTILAGPSFEPIEGRVVIEERGDGGATGDDADGGRDDPPRSPPGEIVAVEEASVDATDIVCPAFVNAHTHIGDSIAKEAGRGLTLEELVAPPDGLKHRLLRAADGEEMVAAMRRSLRYMARGGTAACLEFREGGIEGVDRIERAATGLAVDPVVLGRGPAEVIDVADGYGASGANDDDFADERAAAREAGKLFGIHAGEVDDTDIDPALDLDPDFLVHLVHAGEGHLDRIADRGIPAVVCPRSNLVTDVGLPPVEDLAERTTVALGTDNVMLNSPSMFREMEFAAKLYDLEAPEVLAMATRAGAGIAGLNCGAVEAGRDARLVVLDGDSDNLAGVRDPIRAVVRRAGVDDVKRVLG